MLSFTNYLMNVESVARTLQTNTYAELTLSGNLWYTQCTRVFQSKELRQVFRMWVENARFRDAGQLGDRFTQEAIGQMSFAVTNKQYTDERTINKNQFLDSEGEDGSNALFSWVKAATAAGVYFPQSLVADMILNGASIGTDFDGVPFFATNHPTNPALRSGSPTYSNIITSVPVGSSVGRETSLASLATIRTAMAALKLPGGQPRFLKPGKILCSSKVYPWLAATLGAEFIAGSSSGGGGTFDIKAMKSALGFGQPIEVPEFNGTAMEDDLIVIPEQAERDEFGPFVYSEREPVQITYFSEVDGSNTGLDLILAHKNELTWTAKLRGEVRTGQPHLAFWAKHST